VIRYQGGTLLVEGAGVEELPEGFVQDPRVGLPRSHAWAYHELVLDWHRKKVAFRDDARQYASLERAWTTSRTARPYQQEALTAWQGAGRRGCVVLPTGAGKSFVAELCIADVQRSTLVVAPTIDLVGQWYDGLVRAFGKPVGVLGGGHHEVCDITVSTYDSAWMHMERYGNRFGLLVFDEVHHLPGPSYGDAARCSIAPFRLGLTATLERADGAHAQLDRLVGPVVYRKEITELAGEFLADYRTEILSVTLTAQEREAYERARETFRSFVSQQGLRLGGSGGWNRFLRVAARSNAGRRAHACWRESRKILQASEAKLRLVSELLRRHPQSRVLLFTSDNATVYALSRALLVPAITHQTDVKERRAILEAFRSGEMPVLATSKVLNEGVDLPCADVGIILSGSNTVREHVQRLGRILRPKEGKQAVLYELIVANSTEERSSQLRREHVAYRRE